MSGHAPECEEADPGSLCDCDCAGARHAVRRTKGAVPGAGQVSKRAQRIAARDGRASVVNNRAEPSGRARRGPDLPPEPVKVPAKVPAKARRKITPPPVLRKLDPPAPPEPEPAKPARTRKPATATREAMLTPTTAAKARQVRDSLPKDPAGWKAAAAAKPDPDTVKAAKAGAVKARKAADKAKAAEAKLLDTITDEKLADWKADVAAGRIDHTGGTPDADAMRRRIREHTQFSDKRAVRAHYKWGKAELAAVQAEQAHATLSAPDARMYPVDEGSGLRMPTPALTAHLEAVKGVGRAALADAKRQWERDESPQVAAARDVLAKIAPVDSAVNDLSGNRIFGGVINGKMPEFTHPDGTMENLTRDRYHELLNLYAGQQHDLAEQARTGRRLIAAHQANTLRRMLAQHREFGGTTHTEVTRTRDVLAGSAYKPQKARSDWRKRLTTAEQHFPTDWLDRSAAQPLRVASSDRAYYSPNQGLLSMPAAGKDKNVVDGALDYADEVNVHEMGHRMETLIPGLTHLEFAYVRQRATGADGTVEPVRQMDGYTADEKAQHDRWGVPYAGKSYEARKADRPGEQSWEVFQVGLQDLFARTSRVFGPTDDPEELQAFTIGALLTLG